MYPAGIRLRYFTDENHPAPADALTADDLRRLIRRERILPAHEWLRKAMTGALRPLETCLTFDGGLRCQRDIAMPVLREFELTAFWFVCSSPLQGNIEHREIDELFIATCFPSPHHFFHAFFDRLETSPHFAMVNMLLEESASAVDLAARFQFVRDRILCPADYRDVMDTMIKECEFDVAAAAENLWLRDSDILDLHRQSHVIGLHAHSGWPGVGHLHEDAQREEYFQNYHHLHLLVNERPITMSHPGGRFNHTTLQILRELEIAIGFSVDADRSAGPLAWPRRDVACVALQNAA
jgi:peptidoglycan/xylan/chitin deacetylase (PgdA/CDA1 family)